MRSPKFGEQNASKLKGDPEYQLFPDGWEAKAAWAKPKTFPQTENIQVNSPNRSTLGP